MRAAFISPDIPGRGQVFFHHVLSIITHFLPVVVCHHAAGISLVGYLAELSTPFVNNRWMLKEGFGGASTTVYVVNGALMAIVFFACRILNVGFMLYRELLRGSNPRPTCPELCPTSSPI